MPSSFLAQGLRQPAKKRKHERIFTYERDIICLPHSYYKKMSVNCLPIPRGNKARQYLARHGLLGKITLTSDMNESQIMSEIYAIFKDSFGRDKSSFSILQPTGGFSKSLTIPRVGSLFKWSASSVAGKNPKVPVYILANEPLKVFKLCFMQI